MPAGGGGGHLPFSSSNQWLGSLQFGTSVSSLHFMDEIYLI